jgi:hypothetical protein
MERLDRLIQSQQTSELCHAHKEVGAHSTESHRFAPASGKTEDCLRRLRGLMGKLKLTLKEEKTPGDVFGEDRKSHLRSSVARHATLFE